MSRLWVAGLALPALLGAQDISLTFFASLAPKATEKVEVTLDGPLLQMASVFLDDKDEEESKVKNIVRGLKGIYVRSFTFAKPGEYSDADVQGVRAQLRGWNPIVSVQQAEKSTGIYLKTEGNKIQGMVVLAAEPTELTVVNIVGSIDLEQLRELSGHLGIPELSGTSQKKSEKVEKKK